jgi:hypothetical protein
MVAIVVMALVILFICFILLLGWVDGCCVIIMLEVLMYCVISCWFDRGWGVIIYWVKVVIYYQSDFSEGLFYCELSRFISFSAYCYV